MFCRRPICPSWTRRSACKFGREDRWRTATFAPERPREEPEFAREIRAVRWCWRDRNTRNRSASFPGEESRAEAPTTRESLFACPTLSTGSRTNLPARISEILSSE
uniref:(northern house mosquito) hypothetical protein n=1 Tax=Culex pipiens TaxID=7175 RepID=A0A8D8ANC5_CULPI